MEFRAKNWLMFAECLSHAEGITFPQFIAAEVGAVSRAIEAVKQFVKIRKHYGEFIREREVSMTRSPSVFDDYLENNPGKSCMGARGKYYSWSVVELLCKHRETCCPISTYK